MPATSTSSARTACCCREHTSLALAAGSRIALFRSRSKPFANIARINAVQPNLDEVAARWLDTIEKVGYAPHIQDRYDERHREESELVAELVNLESLLIKPQKIRFVSENMLRQWIDHMRETLECGNRGLARHAIQQFVAKIVIKDGTGMLYYTFPLEGELYAQFTEGGPGDAADSAVAQQRLQSQNARHSHHRRRHETPGV